ncbi:MAG: ATP-binding cassette domain-containing protein [Solirubrobacterales bacterium]
MGDPAIRGVRDLRKTYGELEAVRGISFDVARGEVFGLLGPNGAGKTTTVEILEGYRERTSGEVAVLGLDPGQRPPELRERVGIVLQQTGIYRNIRVREALVHFAGLYAAPRDPERGDRPRRPGRQAERWPGRCRAASCAGSTWRWRSSATRS